MLIKIRNLFSFFERRNTYYCYLVLIFCINLKVTYYNGCHFCLFLISYNYHIGHLCDYKWVSISIRIACYLIYIFTT